MLSFLHQSQTVSQVKPCLVCSHSNLKETPCKLIYEPPIHPATLLPTSPDAQRSCVFPVPKDPGGCWVPSRNSTAYPRRGPLKRKASIRACLASPHFPGEGSVLVIQKGQGIRSGHRQSRLPRRSVTENDPQPSKRREPEEAWPPPCSRPPSPVGGLARAHPHGGVTRAAGPTLCAPSPSHAQTAHTQPLPLPLPVTLPNMPESGKPRFWSAGPRGKPGTEDLAKHKRGRSH